MTKWADYLISAVKYDSDRRIIQVRQHKDTGEAIGDGEIVDKATIASNINNGISYKTIFSSLSTWKLGDRVKTSRVDNDFCLRIDDNKVKHDNLGPLPELEPNIESKNSSQIIPVEKSQPMEKISDKAKAMLKNMGASSASSIQSFQINSRETPMSETKIHESEKTKGNFLVDYEKDYLNRMENLKIKSDPIPPDNIVPDSPHGTLPKGFESKSHEFESENRLEQPKDTPSVPDSPHGTLPKGFESKPHEFESKNRLEQPKDTSKKEQASDKQSEKLAELEKQIENLKKAVDDLTD